MIKASSLTGYAELVAERGGDPAALLRAVGLRPRMLDDPDAFIAYRSLAQAMELAASTLADPFFGLELGSRQGLDILGPIAVIAQHSPTVGAALDDIARYLVAYSPAIAIAVVPASATVARFEFEITATEVGPVAQAYDLSLAVALQSFRILAGERFTPARVLLPHAPVVPPAAYRERIGCPVLFDQDVCGFEFDAGLLERHLATDDPRVRRLAVDYLSGIGTPAAERLEDRVRLLVGRTLAAGHFSIEATAGHLALHPRTLQRRLAADGLRFADLVDDVRQETARRYLAESGLQLGQISALLGYSEQSAFSRACVRWFGDPPRAVRRRLARSADGDRDKVPPVPGV
ncbi:AraC family transcriptional regulator [Nocardioides sp. YIM 152588]|uniref:AraC family transcriptional regulator n=1 Tax=Nocardioides sp. YIM 152588 TaxID=3158259 RepID=UPI0032E39A6D